MAAGLKPHAEAVYITQHFIFARPASHINAAGKVKRGAKGWPRGDVDNYEKALWDALKGSAFTDDDQIVQAVAQMLTRVGIATKVETLPFSVYVSRANKVEFSAALLG